MTASSGVFLVDIESSEPTSAPANLDIITCYANRLSSTSVLRANEAERKNALVPVKICRPNVQPNAKPASRQLSRLPAKPSRDPLVFIRVVTSCPPSVEAV
ncbi:hypothetical protein BH23CHL5_BH23CHL5_14990 [soil metagenome]